MTGKMTSLKLKLRMQMFQPFETVLEQTIVTLSLIGMTNAERIEQKTQM